MSLITSPVPLKSFLHFAALVTLVVAMTTLGTCASAPLPSGHTGSAHRERRAAETLRALCYRRTDEELQQQLAGVASKIYEEIIVLPMKVEDRIVNVGAVRKTFGILSKPDCSPCIKSTLDYDASRFPQYMLVTGVAVTERCENLFLPDIGKTVTVLVRDTECSEEEGEERLEKWVKATVTLPQAVYHYSNSTLSNYCQI